MDIDNTVADKGTRDPYDYSKVSEDTVIAPIADLVGMFDARGYWILFVSGREDSCRHETQKWLDENLIPNEELIMRPAGDYRPDEVVKAEIYREHIEPVYDVRYVLDDRNKVVRMWRELGLTVLQVADGDF